MEREFLTQIYFISDELCLSGLELRYSSLIIPNDFPSRPIRTIFNVINHCIVRNTSKLDRGEIDFALEYSLSCLNIRILNGVCVK